MRNRLVTSLLTLTAGFATVGLVLAAHAAPPVMGATPALIVDPKIQLLNKPHLSEADRVTLLTWLRAHPPAATASPAPVAAPTTDLLRTGLFRLPAGYKIPVMITNLLPGSFGFTLSFDEPALTDGAVVDSFYTPYGATFSVLSGSLTPPSPHVYARAQPSYFPASSPPNVVSVIPAPLVDNSFDERSGTVHVQFTAYQKSVSIMTAPEVQFDNCFGPVTVAPYLRLRDANGNILQTVSLPITNGGFATSGWTPLSWISSSANIASAEFSSSVPSSGCHVYGFFDQLVASPF